MADYVDDTVNLLWLAAIGAAAWLLYELYVNGTDFINGLFGVKEGAGSYSNALSQTVQNPGTTAANILGVGAGYGSSSGGTVSGTLITDISGKNYRCNGSQCYPVTVNADGNEVVTGVPVAQGSINAATSVDSDWSMIGSLGLP